MLPEISRILAERLPKDVIVMISKFVGPPEKKKKQQSPTFQKDLLKIQNSPLGGKSTMYLRDLDDFCLD